MALFICAKCGCVENTALSTFHYRKDLKYTDGLEEYQDKPLCSECGRRYHGRMIPGKWHGQFPKALPTEEERKICEEYMRLKGCI